MLGEVTKMIKDNECNLCGHKWVGRKEKPLCCPNCKRYDWNKPKIKEEVQKYVLQNKEEPEPRERSEGSEERNNKSDIFRRVFQNRI